MRPLVYSPDANGAIDPPVESLLRQIPNKSTSLADCDAVIVPITKFGSYKFNPNLPHLNKPWVLVDFSENGWDWDQEETMLFGKNAENFFGSSYNDEWRKFDQFIVDHPPILTFKRELLEKDRSETLLPIEYTSWLPEYGMDTEDEFKKRVLDVSYVWSRSHEARPIMAGEIFTHAGILGYDVISQFDHIDRTVSENPNSLKWLSVQSPHFARLDVKEVQKVVMKSKITIAMSGCGEKCFRHGENCSDAIMAIPRSRLAWSYPWNESNSIQLPCVPGTSRIGESIKIIRDSLMRPDIYELYCRAMINGQCYRYPEYLRRNVMANIEKRL